MNLTSFIFILSAFFYNLSSASDLYFSEDEISLVNEFVSSIVNPGTGMYIMIPHLLYERLTKFYPDYYTLNNYHQSVVEHLIHIHNLTIGEFNHDAYYNLAIFINEVRRHYSPKHFYILKRILGNHLRFILSKKEKNSIFAKRLLLDLHEPLYIGANYNFSLVSLEQAALDKLFDFVFHKNLIMTEKLPNVQNIDVCIQNLYNKYGQLGFAYVVGSVYLHIYQNNINELGNEYKIEKMLESNYIELHDYVESILPKSLIYLPVLLNFSLSIIKKENIIYYTISNRISKLKILNDSLYHEHKIIYPRFYETLLPLVVLNFNWLEVNLENLIEFILTKNNHVSFHYIGTVKLINNCSLQRKILNSLPPPAEWFSIPLFYEDDEVHSDVEKIEVLNELILHHYFLLLYSNKEECNLVFEFLKDKKPLLYQEISKSYDVRVAAQIFKPIFYFGNFSEQNPLSLPAYEYHTEIDELPSFFTFEKIDKELLRSCGDDLSLIKYLAVDQMIDIFIRK